MKAPINAFPFKRGRLRDCENLVETGRLLPLLYPSLCSGLLAGDIRHVWSERPGDRTHARHRPLPDLRHIRPLWGRGRHPGQCHITKKRAVKENYLANVPMWLLQGSCVLLVLLSWRCLVPLKRGEGAQSGAESEDTTNQ